MTNSDQNEDCEVEEVKIVEKESKGSAQQIRSSVKPGGHVHVELLSHRHEFSCKTDRTALIITDEYFFIN